MTGKKATLSGRKRLSDLGDESAVTSKKAELQAMQAEIQLAETTSSKAQASPTTTRSSTPTTHTDAQARSSVNRSNTPAVDTHVQSTSVDPLTLIPKATIQKAAKTLWADYQKRQTTGTSQRRAHSPTALHQLLLNEIEQRINQEADRLLKAGHTRAEIHIACAHFLSALSDLLLSLGAPPCRLHLSPNTP